MPLLQTDLFTTAERRLAWTSERQAVLARNIANLDTPGFQAADSRAFQQVLSGAAGVQPVRTNTNHLTGTVDPGMAVRANKDPTIRTVDKNGVRLEEQLMKVAGTETIHSTVTAIYKKYMSMFGIALGRPV
ncbi:MAG: flagellar biosynthesis protein FlgB [Acetobacteraceae bacterium]|nr:flagellar biosynthesis protein FlgB [Acetobacteraceae bacterium]